MAAMANQAIAFAIPVLPGKTAALRELAKTVSGPKANDYDQHEKRFKIDKESWFLQRSPQGDWFVAYFEPKDTKWSEAFTASKEPFDLWLKDRLKEISGIDFSAPPPPGTASSEWILKYRY
jgi:hypothetical protein